MKFRMPQGNFVTNSVILNPQVLIQVENLPLLWYTVLESSAMLQVTLFFKMKGTLVP